jgi:hypothetical protein
MLNQKKSDTLSKIKNLIIITSFKNTSDENFQQIFLNEENTNFKLDNLGNILDINNNKITNFIRSAGYNFVDLNGKFISIHQIIASIFLCNTENKSIKHIDENKTNNNVNNLELIHLIYMKGNPVKFGK